MTNYHFDLTGRTVLVTGASSGLGARFGRILGASGANVVLAARRLNLVQALQAEIEAAGGRAIAVAMDVADEASTKAAYDAAEAAFGPVDSVIANAGTNVEGLALDIDADALDRIFSVNVRGVFLTAREGARRMIAAGSPERRHGRVVIISSITATAISPGTGPYSASKAAVLQLGRVLARDWARQGINVNMICPGYIETDMNAEWFETDGGRKQMNKWPRRRLMSEDSLDATMLYFASDVCRDVTGSSIIVDDGQSLAS